MKRINASTLANKVLEETKQRLSNLNIPSTNNKITVSTVRISNKTKPLVSENNKSGDNKNNNNNTKELPKLLANEFEEDYAERYARRLAEKLNIEWKTKLLPKDCKENEVIAAITALNYDSSITGILCTRPLPGYLSARKIHESINPLKDIEGMHPSNIGRVVYGNPVLWPCTARSAVELCASAVELSGLEALVIGSSDVVAKPIVSLLQARGSTVTVCRPDSPKLPVYTRRSDAIFSSQGSSNFVLYGDMLKPNSILIDVGFRIDEETNRVYGDVDLNSCLPIVAAYSTIQHGISLLRTSYLLLNVAIAAEMKYGKLTSL